MSAKVKLKNVSDRVYQLAGDINLSPKGIAEVDAAEANRLVALYGEELEIVGAVDAPAPAAAPEGAPKAPADMTVKELRAELTSRSVKFANTVDKDGLTELLITARGVAPAPVAAPEGAENEETPEAKQAREAAEAAARAAGLTPPAAQ